MENFTQLSAWLAAFGKHAGTTLRLADNGVCALTVGGGLVCTVELPQDASLVTFHADVASLRGQVREPILTRALTLNLYTRETAGATLALDAARDAMVLCLTRPMDGLDEVRFSSTLATFIATARRLALTLGEVDALAAAGSAEPPPSSFMFQRA
jgi:Tir chaperone protein (CesT) family